MPSDSRNLDGFSHQLSAASKTTQHNDFLSLFTQARMTQPLSLRGSTTSTTTTQLAPSVVASASRSRSEDEAHNGTSLVARTVNANAVRAHSCTHHTGNRLPEASKRHPAGVAPSATPTRRDADFDFLVHGLNSVVIKDMAVEDSKTLQLPKGYPMDSEVQPAFSYAERATVTAHVKRKRQEGVLKKSKHEWRKDRYGFRPQEVNWTGAVSLENCRRSSLSNDIHPLLVRSRFDDTPDAIYDRLIPALRLATMFLTQPIRMQFWVTLALGERMDDKEMSFKYGKYSQRVGKHVEMTKENTVKVAERLREIGQMDIIHFAFKHKLGTDAGSVWGFTQPICDYLGARKTYGRKDRLTRTVIKLHSDHYIIARKLSPLKYLEFSQQLRFSFFFASLIMHELAHAIEGAYVQMRDGQWQDYQRSQSYLETFWLDWQRPECGRAWEQTMFGGEIQPINNRADGSHGICTRDWPPHGIENDPERCTYYTVPMTYVENLFQTNTWQRCYNLKDWRTFHIPRTGATSLYICYFTTMPLSEERRVADADLAELVATARDQPAQKMRITSAGDREEQRPKDEQLIEQAVVEEKQQEDGDMNDPAFTRTPRLSSTIPGTPPSHKPTHPILTLPADPQAKPSRTENISAWEETPNEYIHDSLARQQLDQLRATSRKIDAADRVSAAGLNAARAPISEVAKRTRKQPLGLLQRWRRRRRAEAQRRRTAAVVRKEAEFVREELARKNNLGNK